MSSSCDFPFETDVRDSNIDKKFPLQRFTTDFFRTEQNISDFLYKRKTRNKIIIFALYLCGPRPIYGEYVMLPLPG